MEPHIGMNIIYPVRPGSRLLDSIDQKLPNSPSLTTGSFLQPHFIGGIIKFKLNQQKLDGPSKLEIRRRVTNSIRS